MSIVTSFLSPSTRSAYPGVAATLLRISLGAVLLAHGLFKAGVVGLQGSGQPGPVIAPV